ncbi:lipid-A-disaccharide synthase [Desulfosoma sp.]|uniref:lipid-A-disaccharide synthase n=1 Tax=Desulfosoma sp. TaxID=2603217 RepID=UPI004049D20C
MKRLRILVSAGEASGDLHGSRLVTALRTRNPWVHVDAMGGPQLRAAGAHLLVDYRDLALIGVREVFSKVRLFYRALRDLRRYLQRQRPHLVILIDFPDFNFLLGRMARSLGLKVFYYISPQVWAWRSGRIRSLKRFVDAMAVILPFEEAFYEQRGMTVRFVGHPLVDEVCGVEDAATCRRFLGVHQEPVICLLPGSRSGEIKTFLPILVKAAERVRQDFPSAEVVLPVAPGLDRHNVSAMLKGSSTPVRCVFQDTYRAIRASQVALAVSGTVTLEAALLGTPLVVVYKVSTVEYHVARHILRVPYIALPNLIVGRRVCPELLQHEAEPERLAQEAMLLLKHPERAAEQRHWFGRLADMLGKPGAAQRAASMALDLC